MTLRLHTHTHTLEGVSVVRSTQILVAEHFSPMMVNSSKLNDTPFVNANNSAIIIIASATHRSCSGVQSPPPKRVAEGRRSARQVRLVLSPRPTALIESHAMCSGLTWPFGNISKATTEMIFDRKNRATNGSFRQSRVGFLAKAPRAILRNTAHMFSEPTRELV